MHCTVPFCSPPPPRNDASNPVQHALRLLHDTDDVDPEVGGASGGGERPGVSFRLLFNVTGTLGVDEHCTMLLYSLLRLCPQFQEYVLVRCWDARGPPLTPMPWVVRW